jgi:hypothetical protein
MYAAKLVKTDEKTKGCTLRHIPFISDYNGGDYLITFLPFTM